MRDNKPSRSMNWCLSAPATWPTTNSDNAVVSTLCVPFSSAASALSTGTKSGSGSTPYTTTGKPAAEL